MKENFEGPRGKAKYKAKIMTPHAERERERVSSDPQASLSLIKPWDSEAAGSGIKGSPLILGPWEAHS